MYNGEERNDQIQEMFIEYNGDTAVVGLFNGEISLT